MNNPSPPIDEDDRRVVCGCHTGLACPDCEGITPLCASCDCPKCHEAVALVS